MPENCFSLTWDVVKWTEAILPDIGGLWVLFGPACSLQEMDKRFRFDKVLFKCKQITVIQLWRQSEAQTYLHVDNTTVYEGMVQTQRVWLSLKRGSENGPPASGADGRQVPEATVPYADIWN